MNEGLKTILAAIGAAAVLGACLRADPGPVLETKFDKDLIPGAEDIDTSAATSGGRQIVRNRAGAWFVAFDGKSGPYIATARGDRVEGRHFTKPVSLGTILGIEDQNPSSLILAIDSMDRLQIAWKTNRGIHHAWCDVSGEDGHSRISRAEAWKTSGDALIIAGDLELGDMAADARGRLWIAFCREGAVWVAGGHNGWKAVRIADPQMRWAVVTQPPKHAQYEIRQIEEGCKTPVLDIDSDGTLHVAFGHRWEVYYSRSRDGIRWSGMDAGKPRRPDLAYWDSPFPNADRAAYAHASHPSLVVWRGKPLIVYQFEGFINPAPFSPDYTKQRWNGVASVGYAFHDGKQWNRGFISKSQEIMVKRLPPGEGKEKAANLDGAGRAVLAVEQQWKPVIGLDRYGIPWIVWNDTTRRYSYFARWMGTGFSEKKEWRGAFYGLGQHATIEKHPPVANDLGTGVVATGRFYFCRLPVPGIDPTQDYHHQVLDLAEFSRRSNIAVSLTPFERDPASPVFGPNPNREAWDGTWATGRVTYAGGVYRMIYAGTGPHNWEAEKGDVTNAFLGYAESKDGLRFERKNLGLVSFRGSRENNLVHNVEAFEDPDETDPAKRFKGFISMDKRLLAELGKPGRVLLATSADMVHWTVQEDITERAPQSDHGAGPSYKDPLDIAERRYKSIHRSYNLSGRAIGMSYAAQLLGPWQGFEDVLDYEQPYKAAPYPTKVRSGWLALEAGGGMAEDQVYGAHVWIEDGVYYMQYTPCYYDGRYVFSLAMSRDGVNFYRIMNGQASLSASEAGNWDGGIIGVPGSIIDRGAEKWIYYSGSPWHHNTMVRPGGRRALTGGIFGRPEWYVGLARVRNHAWTYATVADAAQEGVLDTLPFRVVPGTKRKLLANWAGKLEVEILDGLKGTPVPGFSRKDCLLAGSGLDIPVGWRGGQYLPAIERPVLLRFYLSGARTRLHGFRFSD
jgi:hypothetical protein